MPVTILVGAQWGDEGKGRFVDMLAASAQIVARYSGGDNAGHTIAVGDVVYKLHLIPSGILHANAVALMGPGMVINPVNLVKEIEELRTQGIEITPQRLKISSRAHMITPAHIEMDRAKERALGGAAIGTTLRGIGPAYLDKADRRGLRIGEILDPEGFAESLTAALERANQRLNEQGGTPVDVAASVAQFLDAAYTLRPFVTDTTQYLNQALMRGERMVCEGAQGTLLDLDHGSYPFVTSSSASAGGALTGLGIGPRHVDRVMGIAKAFSTRVGSGPMPTELNDEVGNRLRGTGENFWDEFGTTTGRPRRCGWLDAVMLRYSSDVNGFTELALTKLDVLSGLDELKIAVAYEVDGVRTNYPPTLVREIERAQPVYESMPGWQEPIDHIRHAADLPQAALDYIRRIEQLCGVPVRVVSVGPERDQIIWLDEGASRE